MTYPVRSDHGASTSALTRTKIGFRTTVNLLRRLRSKSPKFYSQLVAPGLQKETRNQEKPGRPPRQICSPDKAYTLSASPALRNELLLSSADNNITRCFPNHNQLHKTLQTISFPFPSAVAQPPTSTTNTSNVVICSRPAYRLRFSYGSDNSSERTGQYLFNARAGINLVNKALIPPQWMRCFKRGKLPSFFTVIQEPFRMEKPIILHVRLCELYARVWFGII